MLDVKRWQFSVEEFHRMVEVGLLKDDDRVELIQGELVAMSPIGSPHAACVDALTQVFAPLLVQRSAVVRIQGPLQLGAQSEVYPDVLVLRPHHDRYRRAMPGPGDVLLLIEVSDTTLRYDREVKAPLYARAGVPEVWIVDLGGDRILVHTEPMDGEYSIRQVRRGATLAFADLRIGVDEILG